MLNKPLFVAACVLAITLIAFVAFYGDAKDICVNGVIPIDAAAGVFVCKK